ALAARWSPLQSEAGLASRIRVLDAGNRIFVLQVREVPGERERFHHLITGASFVLAVILQASAVINLVGGAAFKIEARREPLAAPGNASHAGFAVQRPGLDAARERGANRGVAVDVTLAAAQRDRAG